ncbi:hypothetical protein KQI08_04560 [Paraeggerthella hongkongensis]|uniref:hypothetical protein n=1 Tax=Paraeggerthella hominis TaxID=2897351 RepID=UPI001C11D7D5|nr:MULTISPECIES: hypothetical protein [Paraeggerthella]MBU5405192.1 hypothetical protein [Paraeggerthella hongkongensis]MCD2433439.1 hypothetical protein [Paraeggerthella hominis]
MKLEPFYCDMHIHTYSDANKRENATYDASMLIEKVRLNAKGKKIMISLTDHNVINGEAYKEVLSKCDSDLVLIVGVELHVSSNGSRPYHAHAYFDASPSDEGFINRINRILDSLYPNKLPGKDDQIPTLSQILNELRKEEFLFLPHGGQSHSTFDNAVGEDELCDDLIMRSVYYNTFDGFTARSSSNVENTVTYFEKIGIAQFTNLLTGSDNYTPSEYPTPKAAKADAFTPTWIYADPSFNGLRLALSEESRLRYGNVPPDIYSTLVPSIERAQLKSKNIDLDISLSAGLNVVIGGSSTGKTLLLEAIARTTNAITDEDRHECYDKFGVDDIVLDRNDSTIPYYINQSYISKVVDKSVDHETIESIQILKDVFPQDQDASDGLDADFETVRALVSKLFAAAEKVQNAELALGRLRTPEDLILSQSLDSNPITLMRLEHELEEKLSWKPQVETKLENALSEAEALFETNPLLESFKREADLVRIAIAEGKRITKLSSEVNSVLKDFEELYSATGESMKQSDKQKKDDFKSVLKSITELRDGLIDFDSTKARLVKLNFQATPRTEELAGHHLSVIYSFRMSPDVLLAAINSVLNSDHRFDRFEDVAAENLTIRKTDGRKKIKSMSSFSNAVTAALEKEKKRTFSIITANGVDWALLSEGRKTAVLLDLILSFKGNTAPLLIDQPEDNLASDYINGGLSGAIRGSKATRQTIVVTHNATIPMMADAQTVVLCRSEGGKLIVRSAPLEGVIEGKRALDWIADITDGGKQSVQKRFRKYNFRKFGD